MQREAELWDTTEKRTVRCTDGPSGEHIDPNIHNIDTDVGIVFTSNSVMRFLLKICIQILYLQTLHLQFDSCSYRVAL